MTGAGCADKNSNTSLFPEVAVFEDTTGNLTLKDILENRTAFKELDSTDRNLTFTYSAWWIKLTFNKTGIPDGDYFLVYNQSWTKTVDAYIPEGNDFTLYSAGNENGFSARPVKNTSYAFPVNIRNGAGTFYFRLKSNYRIVCDFRLITKDAFLQKKTIEELFYAIIVAFLIYNLILFVFIKGKEYIYYALFLITFVIFLLSYDGTGFMYFWSNSPGFNDYALTGMLVLQSMWVILFFIEYTDLKKNLPRAAVYFQVIAFLAIPSALLKIIFPDKHVMLWLLPFLQLIAVSLISVSFYMTVKGSKTALYFFSSFIILLGFSLVNSFISFGFLDENFTAHIGMHAGASACAVLFSLGMAYRINSLRIQQALSESIVKKQNVQLEHKNDELAATNQELQAAMEELEATNEELNAIMDELQDTNKQLWDSEQRLQGIFDSASVAISITDITGKITQVNDYAAYKLGYDKKELTGKSFKEITHPDDLKNGIDLFGKLASGDISGYRYDKRYLKKDGTPWMVDVSTSILRSESGEITGLIGIAVDITDKIESQRDRDKMQQQLWQIQKQEAIGTLASGIAHDFNNILAAIMGYTELAIDELNYGGNPSDELQQVLNSSVRARDIVRQILTLSRKGENIKSPQHLIPLIEESIKLMRATTPSTIQISFQNNSDHDTVICDVTQIEQVFINLCTNANHAMSEKGGILSVTLTDKILDEKTSAIHKVKPGKFITIEFTDTGKGMNNGIMERIFDPFFSTKPPGLGTGLGLSVVLGIILDHGGFITVESTEGKGSSFSVHLPATTESIITKSDDKTLLSAGNERILLVDDEHVIAEMNRLILQKLGYRITSVSGSLEALEIFKASPDDYDLLITDQTMPHMTGIDLANEIRRIRPGLPVILCTGHSDLVDSENYRSLGIDEFLYKPVTTEDLADAIRRTLDKKQS